MLVCHAAPCCTILPVYCGTVLYTVVYATLPYSTLGDHYPWPSSEHEVISRLSSGPCRTAEMSTCGHRSQASGRCRIALKGNPYGLTVSLSLSLSLSLYIYICTPNNSDSELWRLNSSSLLNSNQEAWFLTFFNEWGPWFNDVALACIVFDGCIA